ncbi:hypothetical protein ACFYNZ_16340 [Streptomyces kebangsaanensis]|uniref:Uncharacterized protein n=1 Tax=Streptomyces kebangsaanensis TaxID=864058 RepID=A0ABW6KXB5_9ACTN
MSTENGRPRNGVLLGAAIDCPGGSKRDGDGEDAPPVRLVDRTDSRERAVLMRAFSNGNTRLTEDQPDLGAACAAVVKSGQRVERGITAVDRFRRTGGALSTEPVPPVAVRKDARPEAAEERTATRRRPRVAGMWRRLVWPVTGAGALFDSAFVGSVIQQVLDVGPGTVQYWLAYLPGLGIAVCLLAAGTLLAEHMASVREARSADAAGRGGEGRDSRRWWRRPLAVPWLFTFAVLGLIATCGVVRVLIAVQDSGDGYLTLFQPVVVVLLLLLGIAAVATKLLSHDPEAAADAEEARLTRKAEKALRKHTEAAEKALRKRMKAADELTDEARKALVAHVTAWFTLKAALDATEQGARRHVEDASTDLVEERARTGTAGTFEFPLRAAAWPPERVSKTACARQGTLVSVQTQGGPEIRLDLLGEARQVLTGHHPDGLARRLRDALEELDRQWGPADPSDDETLGDEEAAG